jgi:hypothetical protein
MELLMRLAPLLLALTITCGSACASASKTVPAPNADSAALDTPFSVRTETRVPGKLLKPGNYVIRIKDHLSDRAILEVSSPDGKVLTTFLGALHSGLQATSGTGPIKASLDKGHDALRGFTFPGGGTVEFVYPKAEAADLVSKTSEPVLAIDPASDNLHSSGQTLSREDSQIVTLWSLQATRLSPTENGIAAKKFVPQPDSGAPVATAAPQAPKLAPTLARAKRPTPDPSSQVAANHVPSAVKALPKTASNLPLLLLSILASFGVTIGLRIGRSRQA